MKLLTGQILALLFFVALAIGNDSAQTSAAKAPAAGGYHLLKTIKAKS